MKLITKIIFTAFISIILMGCGGDGKDKITINGDETNNTTEQLLETNNKIDIDLNSDILESTTDNLKIYAYKKRQYLTYQDDSGKTINIGDGIILPDGTIKLENGEIINKTYSYTSNGVEYILENGNIYRLDSNGGKYFISKGEIDENNNLISKTKMTIVRESNEDIIISDKKYAKITDNLLLDEATGLVYSYYTNENGLITISGLYEGASLITVGGVEKIEFYIDSDYDKLSNLSTSSGNYEISYMDCSGNIYYSFNNEIYKKNLLTNQKTTIGKGFFSNEKMQLSGTENNNIRIKKNSVSPIANILSYNIYSANSDKYVNYQDSIYQEVNSIFNYVGNGKIVNDVLYFNSGSFKNIVEQDKSSIENQILLSSGEYYTVNNINKIYKKVNLSETFNYYKDGLLSGSSIILSDGTNKTGTTLIIKNIDVGQLHIDIDGNMYAQTSQELCKIDKNLSISYLNKNVNTGIVYDIDEISTKNVIIDINGALNMSYNGLTYEVYSELGEMKSNLLGAININVDEKNTISIVVSDNATQENLNITKEETYQINGVNISTENVLSTITNDTTDRILLDYEIIDGNIVINTDDERLDGGNDYIIQGEGTITTTDGEDINALEIIDSTITKDFNEAPIVLNVSPDAESLVLNNTIIKISFNKKIKESSVTINNVKLKDSKGNNVSANVRMGEENEIIIIPNEQLLSSEKYTVTVTGITSLEGSFVMDTIFTSYFNTVTDEILKIVKMETSKGSDNLPLPSTNITLILNHPIKVFNNISEQYLILKDKNTNEEIAIVVTQPAANLIVIDPEQNLKNFSEYVLEITLIEEINIDGDPIAQTRNIIIGSDEMTYLQSTYPIEGANTYNIYEQIVLSYNNPLSFTNVIAKNWVLKDLTEPSLEFQLTVTYDYAEQAIKLMPPANMKSEHSFQLLIPTVEDAVGNELPSSTLTFTSEDITPPELILKDAIYPSNGEQFYDFHAPITIQFSEPIDPVSVNTTNVYVVDKETQTNQNLPISVNNNIITLTASSLDEHTEYELNIEDTVSDFNQNTFLVGITRTFKTYDITPPIINIVPDIIPIPDWNLTKGVTTSFAVTSNEELAYVSAEQVYVRPVAPYDGTVDDLKISIVYDKITKTDINGSEYEVDDSKNFKIVFQQFPRPSPYNVYYLVFNRVKDLAGNYITGTDLTYKGGLVDEFQENFVPVPETNKRYIKFVNIDDTLRPYVTSVTNTGETLLKVNFSEKVYIDTALPTSFKIEDINNNNIILDTYNETTDNILWKVNFVTNPACQSKIRLHVTNVYDTSFNKFASSSGILATDTDVFPTNVFYCYQKACNTNYSPSSSTVSDTVAVSTLWSKTIRHLEDDSLYYWDSSKNKIYRVYTDGSMAYIGGGYFSTSSNYIYMDGGGTIKDAIVEQSNSLGQNFYKLTATDGTISYKAGVNITISSSFTSINCN